MLALTRTIALVLVLLVIFGCCALAQTYTIGASGEEVARVQQRLIELGYLEGDADGKYGEKTAAAVRSFQEAHGMSATGEADDATVSALLDTDAQTIQRVQQALIDEGYLEGVADGVYGVQTASALSRWQRNHGLTGTGRMDDATLAALLPDAAATQNADAASGQNAPSAEQVRSAQQLLIDMGYLSGKADGLFGPKTTAALQAFQKEMGLAETGALDDATLAAFREVENRREEVASVQRRLIELGYLTGEADGIFGKSTAAAIRNFQRLQGLEVNGMMNQETLNKMYDEDIHLLRKAIHSGEKGDNVTELQKRLIQLCFLTGEADGSYGKKTAAAVAAFQQHLDEQGYAAEAGIAVDGDATSMTLEYLFSGNYSTFVRSVAPGGTDAEVKRAEMRLIALGYLDAKADDELDDYTVSALNVFRRNMGLSMTTGLDKPVVDALYDADAAWAAHYVPHAIAFGERNEAVRTVQNAMINGGFYVNVVANGKYDASMRAALAALADYLKQRGDVNASLFAEDGATMSTEAQNVLLDENLLGYISDVASGSEGNEVFRVQRRLYTLFYLGKSGVDGDAGSGTQKAIKAFQRKNGLPETGTADRATQERLFSAEAAGDYTPYKLEVSIAEQRVYAYQLNDQGLYELCNTFICSTGENDSTPRGVFISTTRPQERWHYFVKYNCWAQYTYVIEGAILFHSVIYSAPNESALRTSSLYNLGNPASHGCVRLQVEDAKWIFEHCEAHTIIVIY